LHSAYPEYLWYPAVLANASHSAERLSAEYFDYLYANKGGDVTSYIKKAVKNGLGVYDASDAEISLLVDHPETAPYTFADIISRRAQTGWTTHGHSGSLILL
jgi:alkaline phosphatase